MALMKKEGRGATPKQVAAPAVYHPVPTAYPKNKTEEEILKQVYADLKQASADRCPRLLGSKIKTSEIQFHHEVTNQFYWNQF